MAKPTVPFEKKPLALFCRKICRKHQLMRPALIPQLSSVGPRPVSSCFTSFLWSRSNRWSFSGTIGAPTKVIASERFSRKRSAAWLGLTSHPEELRDEKREKPVKRGCNYGALAREDYADMESHRK